MKYMEISVLTV